MNSMDYGMLYLQPWDCLMLPSQRGASKTFLSVFPSENIISLKKRRGEHLICTLHLAELASKLSFCVETFFFTAGWQEVWDSAGRGSRFQPRTIVKVGWRGLVCRRLRRRPSGAVLCRATSAGRTPLLWWHQNSSRGQKWCRPGGLSRLEEGVGATLMQVRSTTKLCPPIRRGAGAKPGSASSGSDLTWVSTCWVPPHF